MAKMNDPAESLAGKPDQNGDDFACNVPASSAQVYSGPYPMIDHITMPAFEPTAELRGATSFEWERDAGEVRSESRGNLVQSIRRERP